MSEPTSFFGETLRLILATLLTVVFAETSFRWIEQPERSKKLPARMFQ